MFNATIVEFQCGGGGGFRIKHHLAVTKKDSATCRECPDDVRIFFDKYLDEKKPINVDEDIVDVDLVEKERKGKMAMFGGVVRSGIGKVPLQKTTMDTFLKKKKSREDVCIDICRCLYANALPFNLVKDPFFKIMMNSVAEFGKGLKLPSYHEARVSFLKKEVESIKELVEKYKDEWKKTGCTLMSDGWTDNRSRSITNFLVNSPRGTVFFKSIDTSDIFKSADKVFEMLDNFLEQIGPENVVQVVTDSASAYVKAGEMLMEHRKHLFWNPCASHCMDLILKDIGVMTVQTDTMAKTRKITVYIYRHSWVVNLMRKCTKLELTRPAVTRFATCYLTLRRLREAKVALKAMFSSEKWQKNPYAKQPDGNAVSEINSDEKFWSSIQYCLKCSLPLVKVLRLVDGDAKPAMGYIYEAMDRAKEQIKGNFKNVKKRYKPIWDIIDLRWDRHLHRPLHAAAYYLNPRFHYSPEFKVDFEVKQGLIKTIERMCPTPELREKIDKQIEIFKASQQMFGMDMAVQMRNKKQPALWWDAYGDSCPELQKLAIRVLSLTCSATGCERNWSTFDQVHTKRRNRLEQQRVDALVFTKYNLRLEARHQKRANEGDLYDPICLSDMESDDEWITEKESPVLPEDNAWMDIVDHECFKEKEGECSKKRKRGPRDINKKGKDKSKGKGKEVLEIEDESTDDEEVEELLGSEELIDVDDDINSDEY